MNFQPKLKEVEMKNMVKNICAAMVISLCAAGHLSATDVDRDSEAFHRLSIQISR